MRGGDRGNSGRGGGRFHDQFESTVDFGGGERCGDVGEFGEIVDVGAAAWDVGASVGEFADPGAPGRKSRIVSFDPHGVACLDPLLELGVDTFRES